MAKTISIYRPDHFTLIYRDEDFSLFAIPMVVYSVGRMASRMEIAANFPA